MSTLPNVAFLGLGHMGGPMAANLVKAGYPVTGYDPVPAAQEQGRAGGLTIVESATDAVRDADVVITMLPNGALVLKLYDEVLSAARPNTLFVDSSTIDVADARAAHADAANASDSHADIDASDASAPADAVRSSPLSHATAQARVKGWGEIMMANATRLGVSIVGGASSARTITARVVQSLQPSSPVIRASTR